MKDFKAIYSNFFMDFRKPTTLKFQLDFNYRVVRLITCLLTLWGGTTVWWFSMKMSLENDFWILSYLGQTVSCHTLKKDFRFDDRRIVAKTKWFVLWKVNFCYNTWYAIARTACGVFIFHSLIIESGQVFCYFQHVLVLLLMICTNLHKSSKLYIH